MASERIPKDQEQQPPLSRSRSAATTPVKQANSLASSVRSLAPAGTGAQSTPFFKKNFLVISMLVLGIILLFPIAIFVISQLSSQKETSKPTIAKKTFAPQAPFIADQLTVKLKESYTREELGRLKKKFDELGVISQEKALLSNDPSLRDYYLIKFKPGTDIKKAGQELIKLPELEEVEPNYIITTQALPSDPYYGLQWDLERIEMPKTWELVKGSNSVKIAVIDTGIDYNHQDFSGRNIIKGLDFATCDELVKIDTLTANCVSPKSRDRDPMDDNGHGTHVSGTIGAVTDNNIGISGINWDVTLMAVKVMGKSGQGDPKDIFDGITYAADNGADVINISLGGPFSCTGEYQNAINYAINKGAIVVAAAGNAIPPNPAQDAKNSSPASCTGVIAVGNSDRDDSRWGSSNFGDTVDIAAPGTEIYSTMPGNAYGSKGGTSMAAPHVSGVVGLLLSINPNLTRDQIESCLINSADPITTDRNIGPRLNAYRAITSCVGTPNLTATSSPTPSPTISPTETPPDTTPRTVTPTGASATNAPQTTKKALSPSPTPVITYTCREDSRTTTALPGSIKIGSLICEPN